MKKLFAVIGLGKFGGALATELDRMGHEVLGVDKSEETVSEFADKLTHCVQADCTEEETVRSLGLNSMDVVVVAIGEIHASIMVVLFLKEMGVPCVVAKCANDIHARLLEKVGADRVVYPEKDMGVRIAHSLVHTGTFDYVELSDDCGMIECAVRPEWVGKSLRDLSFRNKYEVNIIGIRYANGKINISPGADRPLMDSDVLIMLGGSSAISRLEKSAR